MAVTRKIVYALVLITICEFFDLTAGFRCSRVGDIANSSYKERKGYKSTLRTYECKPGYVSNVPQLHKLRFKCDGSIRWWAVGVKIASTQMKLYTDNVTCTWMTPQTCSEPLSRPYLTTVVQQYQLELTKTRQSARISPPRFYSGDKVIYSCKYGYEELVQDYTDYYSFFNDTSVREITCEDSGLWNGLPTNEIDLMECARIQCDATYYQNISNGNITNYKDTYEFQESMHLSCDEGYRSKNELNSLVCVSSTSFTATDFGCELITCLLPVDPINGRVRVDGNAVGDKSYFYCDYGTKLIGESEWTCQANGMWNSSCVVCKDEESYCSPPCIPLGAEMISSDTKFYFSSTVEFTCTGDSTGKSVTRMCMSNRAWSGQPLDCTGESLYDPFVSSAILSAMETIPITRNENSSDDKLEGRMIDVGNALGVDVYFLIDVSRSIDEEKIKTRKKFMKTLLPKLGINNGTSGTRIAVTYFATNVHRDIEQHYAKKVNLFQNYQEAQERIDKITNLTKIQSETGYGTAITKGLENIVTDIKSKRSKNSVVRRAQQVIIIISDGQYNMHGSPEEIATSLKGDPYNAEIYSIMIGSDEQKHPNAYKAMKAIASDKENEQHFFQIRNEDDLSNIIDAMINNGTKDEQKCGQTYPELTNLSNDTTPIYEHDAERHAWPWMAQLLSNHGLHVCGGSLIDKQWILTAAHCLEKTDQVILKKLGLLQQNNIDIFQIRESSRIKHPKYNEKKEQKYKYDVGLIKLPREVVVEKNLLPVCLPTLNDQQVTFQENTFGVVTGWGFRDKDGQHAEILKQMQMSIKDCSNANKTVFDKETMFCAGDKVGQNIIDTCTGDSGGPFSVRMITDESRFIQIGVVSSGIGCKKNDKNGYYTKISEEIVNWITNTTKTN